MYNFPIFLDLIGTLADYLLPPNLFSNAWYLIFFSQFLVFLIFFCPHFLFYRRHPKIIWKFLTSFFILSILCLAISSVATGCSLFPSCLLVLDSLPFDLFAPLLDSLYIFSPLISFLIMNYLSLKDLKNYWEQSKNNPQEIEKMINFCKYAKYAGLTTGLLSAGLAFKSDDENFAKSTSSLALINGLIGIGSEGIKELILEPQKKKLQDGERRGLRENLEENNQSVSSFDTYQTAPELQEIIVENQAQIETSLRQRV